MAKKKLDYVAEAIYGPHLNGGNTRNNPNTSRMMVLTNMYRRVLTELCSNRFRWTGLPTTVDVRFLELTLFRTGMAVFYFEEAFDRFLAVRGTGDRRTNMYDNPTGFSVYGPGLPTRHLEPSECVPIYANYLRLPDLDIVEVYSTKLAEIDRSIEINSKNLRRPKLLVTNDDNRLSMDNINRQLDEGQSAITVSESFMPSDVSAIDLGVEPQSLSVLMETKAKLWGECMTLLGVNNAVQDKKERVQTAEIEANEDQVSGQRDVNLNARREACARINEMFAGSLPGPVNVSFNLSKEGQENNGTGVA